MKESESFSDFATVIMMFAIFSRSVELADLIDVEVDIQKLSSLI